MTDKLSISQAQDTVEALLDGEKVETALLDELLYLLDEVMRLHNLLDTLGAPSVDFHKLDLSLNARIKALIVSEQVPQAAHETPMDFYTKSIQPEPGQLPLF
jgi:hypothetical protein